MIFEAGFKDVSIMPRRYYLNHQMMNIFLNEINIIFEENESHNVVISKITVFQRCYKSTTH